MRKRFHINFCWSSFITRHCLTKNNISIPKNVINPYISYILGPQLRNFKTDFTLSNCVFWSVELTKNVDLHKYKYAGYGIGFNPRRESSLPEGSICKNVIIFGDYKRLSVHIDNKEKDILILGKGPTQGLAGTTFTAEALYPINFAQSGKRFSLGLQYNGSNSFLFFNATKVYQLKGMDSEIIDYALCLGNALRDFTVGNVKKKNRIKRVVKFFVLILILLILTLF